MPYCIQYGGNSVKTKQNKAQRTRKRLISLSILAICIVLCVAFSVFSNTIKDALFPWSETASEIFSKSITSGNSIGTAITAFCRQVLAEAGA